MFGVIGCSAVEQTSPRVLTVAIDQAEYAAGKRVVLTITNHSDTPVESGWCNLQLEQKTAEEQWGRVSDTTTSCRPTAYVLRQNIPITLRYPLPDTLAAGIYRIRDHTLGIVTAAFAVQQR
jgi:hypothetical protein